MLIYYFQEDFHRFHGMIWCALQNSGELDGIALQCSGFQHINWSCVLSCAWNLSSSSSTLFWHPPEKAVEGRTRGPLQSPISPNFVDTLYWNIISSMDCVILFALMGSYCTFGVKNKFLKSESLHCSIARLVQQKSRTGPLNRLADRLNISKLPPETLIAVWLNGQRSWITNYLRI